MQSLCLSELRTLSYITATAFTSYSLQYNIYIRKHYFYEDPTMITVILKLKGTMEVTDMMPRVNYALMGLAAVEEHLAGRGREGSQDGRTMILHPSHCDSPRRRHILCSDTNFTHNVHKIFHDLLKLIVVPTVYRILMLRLHKTASNTTRHRATA